MATTKCLFALLVVASQLFYPVYAKISDLPAFSLWSAQWAPIAGQTRVERLPCLRGAKHSCGGGSSSLKSTRNADRVGSVDPFARSTHTLRTTRRQAVFKKPARVNTKSAYAQFKTRASTRFFPTMLLSDHSLQTLDIRPAYPDIAQAAEVETLAEYVAAVEPSAPSSTSLAGEVTGGLGDSAYVALYDFDDSSAPNGGETTGSFEEITTLLDVNSSRAAATAVPEPKTCLLIGVSLLALRARRGVKLARPGRRQLTA
jgi:hypothetical protein